MQHTLRILALVWTLLPWGLAAHSQSLFVTPDKVSPGGTITVTGSVRTTDPSEVDWIGLYRVGDSDQDWQDWWRDTRKVRGRQDIILRVTLPPGIYELRLFLRSSWQRLAISNPFEVEGVRATLTVSPAQIEAGGTVTVSWVGIPQPAWNDWVGLYLPTDPDRNYRAFKYTTGKAADSISFPLPALPPGDYELRLFARNGYTRLAQPVPLTLVTMDNCPDLRPYAARGGDPCEMEFHNLSSRTIKVYWIDGNARPIQYQTLDPGQAYLQRTYLNQYWLVKDSNGRCRGIYGTGPGRKRVVITD